MRATIATAFILLFSLAAFGQHSTSTSGGKLLSFGEVKVDIEKISKFTKVYVVAGVGMSPSEGKTRVMKAILKKNKSLKFTNYGGLQFHLVYSEPEIGSRLQANYYADGKIYVAWSQTSNQRNTEAELTREFLKAFEAAAKK